ncbi:MAG: murein L,D-transpeptidase catalytic domain family protein, partial [Methyloceanibacter sp.]|nr:murein L,D-transpeptidase catalytic domain family protein [Methyloceanibacter sp.]
MQETSREACQPESRVARVGLGLAALSLLAAGHATGPAAAQTLPWHAAPPPSNPAAVTIVPKTRVLPGSRYVPDVQAAPVPQAAPMQQAIPAPPVAATPRYAPAALAPSPVMPVPNAPIAAPPYRVAPATQPAPAMRPTFAPQPAIQAAPARPIIPGVPAWLNPYIGDSEGKISAIVLKRARDYHQTKVRAKKTKNPCYFAFDATRPGAGARRFYVICEDNKTFRAFASGHGAGRNFEGLADVSNNARCAKNFSNARNSHLTTGGGYLTAETRTSFKGYYSGKDGYEPLVRSFVQFTGEGDTANARARAIGGHSAAIVRWQCRMKMPSSKYADKSGYVPFGKLINYSSGRSSGCTSWPREADAQILAITNNSPTTVYIYPESRDIVAVGRAVRAGKSPSRAGTYWNASCLKEIGEPNF